MFLTRLSWFAIKASIPSTACWTLAITKLTQKLSWEQAIQTVLLPKACITSPVILLSCKVLSNGLSSVSWAKPQGAKLIAAPVSIKMLQAALFLVPIPKLLVLLWLGHLQACCVWVSDSKLPRVWPSLPKLLVWHVLCWSSFAKADAVCCCLSFSCWKPFQQVVFLLFCSGSSGFSVLLPSCLSWKFFICNSCACCLLFCCCLLWAKLVSSKLTFFFGLSCIKLVSQAVPICIPSWPSWLCWIKLPKLIPIVIVCCRPMVFKLWFAPCWSKLDSTPRVGLELPKLVESRSGSDSGLSLSRS